MSKVIVFEGGHGTGKSTIIKQVCANLHLPSSKSVPNWFRSLIPFARHRCMPIQKFMYDIGHYCAFINAKSSDEVCVMDRWRYTTTIRLAYEFVLPTELKYQLKRDIPKSYHLSKGQLCTLDKVYDYMQQFRADHEEAKKENPSKQLNVEQMLFGMRDIIEQTGDKMLLSIFDDSVNESFKVAKEYAVDKISHQAVDADLVIFISADKDIVQSRLQSRDGERYNFDSLFYQFERDIFEEMADNKPDVFKVVSNNAELDVAVNEVENYINGLDSDSEM